MAIYHMSVQTIGRSTGGNALAAAAYRSGEKIGEFDYTKRHHEIDGPSQIFAPDNAPKWCLNRQTLWAEVEKSEKRKDAQLCREINLALPLELNPDERQELLRSFAQIFTAQGMIADTAIHKSKDGQNPHAHIMLTTREITPDGFGKKRREWNSRELLESWRETWAALANHALEKAGHLERIDHRTLAAQGINREPTKHQGKHATHMKGESRICQHNAAIMEKIQIDAEMAQIAIELLAKPKTAAELRKEIRQEDKEDERASREDWEALQSHTTEWRSDEKILSTSSDARGTNEVWAQVTGASAWAKSNLSQYEEEISQMGKLAKLVKRGEIKEKLATLQAEIEKTEEEMSKVFQIRQKNQELESQKKRILQKRIEQWEKSPQAKEYQARHKERLKQIFALEKEEREHKRAMERGWSR